MRPLRGHRGIRGLAALALLLAAAPCQQPFWDPLDTRGRTRHAMAYDHLRGRTVLFGSGGGRPQWYLDTREWDGTRWLRRFPKTHPPGRDYARMAYDPMRGTVILFGGRRASTMLNDTWEWDGQEWRQLSPATSPPPRSHPAMATDVLRGEILLYGGSAVPLGGLALSDTWVWDGSNWVQRFPATDPGPRIDGQMAWCGRTGRMVLFGGNMAGGIPPPPLTWEWDGTTWRSVSATPGSLGNRWETAMTTNPATGRPLLFGGTVAAQGRQDDTWEYDALAGQWLQVPTPVAPRARTLHRLAGDFQRGEVVLWGGAMECCVPLAQETPLATWVFRNGAWTKAHDRPPARDLFGPVHVPTRDRFLLLALEDDGTTTSPLRFQTWVMEDDEYRLLSPQTSPTPRRGGFTAYHEALDRVLLVAGGTVRGSWYLSDAWSWDGTDWRQEQPPPFGPTGHLGLVYDPFRRKVLALHMTPLDLWEWDASGWQAVPAAQKPPLRVAPELGFDPVRRQLVLHGGSTAMGGFPFLDTWEFDGTTWTQVLTASNPGGIQLGGGGLVYVPALGGLVLVSGASETWVYDGTDWRRVNVPREIHDGTRLYTRLAYDSRRQRLRGFNQLFSSRGGGSTASAWDLVIPWLSVQTQHPRPGERMVFDVELPAHAGELFVLGMAFSDRPGIPLLPVPGAGTAWLPLAPDPLLQASLSAGLWAVLDAQGRTRLTTAPLPATQSLVGIRFHAAGLALDAPNVRVTAITNGLPMDIVR